MRYQNKRRPTPKGTLATVLGLLGLLSTVNHAVGADSFICTIDDRTLHLELVGSTNMSDDTRVTVRNGRLTLKPSAFSYEPEEIPIMDSNLILQWKLGRAIRFGIHLRRSDPANTLLVTILATHAAHSAIYHGSYSLKQMGSHGSRSTGGRIEGCVAD